MTTFTFTGVRVDFVNGNDDAVGPADAEITVPSGSATFSYEITGTEDPGVSFIDISDNIIQPVVDDINLDDPNITVLEESTLITSITWSGGTSVVLILNLETSANTDIEFYFVLDGPALPQPDSVQDWLDFADSITNFAVPTGDFAPGADIPWSTIPGVEITQDDEFWGTPGRNVYRGGIGDDYFVSSEGNDVYNGGQGFDQVTFDNDPGGVFASLRSGKATDGWGNTDTLRSIEMLRGSSHDDALVGNGVRNVFRGLEGADTINGFGGRDEVRYDRDSRYGGTDGVEVNLSQGFAVDGFGDRDTLRNIEDVRGSGQRDKLVGNNAANKLDGQGMNDRLFGLGGDDSLLGGTGWDRLNGGFGNDTLNGGWGNDRLEGRAGADTFVFAGRFGDDVIIGFDAQNDAEKIDLSGVRPIKGMFDLRRNHMEQDGDDVVIDDGNGNTITLRDVELSDLGASDFIF